MSPRDRPAHIQALLTHPVVVALGLVAIVAVLGLNAAAFWLGERAPWLLAGVMLTDLLVVAAGIAAAFRLALAADRRVSQAAAALDASQARLAAIVDSAMDAIISVDDGQRIVIFNRAAEQVFRCRREEALGVPLERFIPQRFRGAHRGHIEQFGRTGITSRRMGDVTTLWALRAGGEEFPIEAAISQASEGGRRYFTVILRDITLRKKYEDELKRREAELRGLSARVLEAREEEKTLIARELHDELGQLLTALKMDLAALRERLPAPELQAQAGQMDALLDRTVASVRRISAELRPQMLDDLGLPDAVSWLAEDFGRRAGVTIKLEISDDAALEALERSVANTVYRVLQESLTNVARHAQARRVWVVVEGNGGMLQVEIEDDGRGIAPEDLARPRSLGLKGMRERVHHLGGAVEIGRAPRGGTRIALRLPRQPAAPGGGA